LLVHINAYQYQALEAAAFSLRSGKAPAKENADPRQGRDRRTLRDFQFNE